MMKNIRKIFQLIFLNSIAFSIVSQDLFAPKKVISDGNYTYTVDRGYVFEQQFNENTQQLLDKKLFDYKKPEQDAKIPLLFFTPTIINDARRLVISPQGVTYMMSSPIGTKARRVVEVDAVDFGWLFANHNAQNLSFLSAIRMSATYPYVLPSVRMPTTPQIKILDAGVLDNFGLFSSVRFIHVFKDWILENTSGVVLVQITSDEKYESIEANEREGIITSLINPIGGIAAKLFTIQEYHYDNHIGLLFDLLGPDQFDVIRFICKPDQPNKTEAAVSFHLAEKEKQNIKSAFELESNQKSVAKLIRLLTEKPPTQVVGKSDILKK